MIERLKIMFLINNLKFKVVFEFVFIVSVYYPDTYGIKMFLWRKENMIFINRINCILYTTYYFEIYDNLNSGFRIVFIS